MRYLFVVGCPRSGTTWASWLLAQHPATVIALHTESEQRALFVRAADESVCLYADVSSGSPYLDHQELERVLRVCRADSVWVGWDFAAEDPAFADLCERLGLLFIGAPAQWSTRTTTSWNAGRAWPMQTRPLCLTHTSADSRSRGWAWSRDRCRDAARSGRTALTSGPQARCSRCRRRRPPGPGVFAREVTSRTSKNPRITELEAELATEEGRRAQIRLELAELRTAVRSEKLGEVAEEFEQVNNIERALAVGSVDVIIPARDPRPHLVGAVERGMSRARR